MSNIKYDSELYILTKEYVTGGGVRVNAEKPTERINIPVDSFEVEGGADRKIDFNSGDEISIASEFEQARIYTNFIFYIPPTNNFLPVRLMNLEKTNEFFEIDFIVNTYSKGKKMRTLRLSADDAILREAPMYVGRQPHFLMKRCVWLNRHCSTVNTTRSARRLFIK